MEDEGEEVADRLGVLGCTAVRVVDGSVACWKEMVGMAQKGGKERRLLIVDDMKIFLAGHVGLATIDVSLGHGRCECETSESSTW